MDVTYVGPHNAVEIEVKGQFVTVAKGETVTVPDVVANGDPAENLGGLLDQPDNWKPKAQPKPKPEPKP
jgi:hypothetical protein